VRGRWRRPEEREESKRSKPQASLKKKAWRAEVSCCSPRASFTSSAWAKAPLHPRDAPFVDPLSFFHLVFLSGIPTQVYSSPCIHTYRPSSHISFLPNHPRYNLTRTPSSQCPTCRLASPRM
jgi:hypothetical protein